MAKKSLEQQCLAEHEGIQGEAEQLGLDWEFTTAPAKVHREKDLDRTRYITYIYEGPSYRHIYFYPGSAFEAYEDPDNHEHYYLYLPGIRYAFYNQDTDVFYANMLYLYTVNVFIPRGRGRQLISAWPLPNNNCFGEDQPMWPDNSLATILTEYWNISFNLDADLATGAGFFGKLWRSTDRNLSVKMRTRKTFERWEAMSRGEVIDLMSDTNHD